MALVLLLVCLLAATGVGVLVGHTDTDGVLAIAVLAILSGVAVGLLLGLQGRDADIPSDRFGQGVAAAAFLGGSVPAAAYGALGLLLARRPGWLAVAFVVSLAPLALYGVFLFLSIIDLVACAPDQYECPL